ncbi:winged helix-turn-helix transcriptional regulator [Alphaproteobacteria bacterium LSUCC0684]
MNDMKKNIILDRGDVRCPIAAASAVLTDQWSVIVLRDIAFFGRRTFRDIISTNNEKIPSSTLAKRLKRLVDVGLLRFEGDETHSQRKIYCLTQAGIDLVPIIIGMAVWSTKHHIFDAHTIEFLKPLQEKNNPALDEFIKKLGTEHLD